MRNILFLLYFFLIIPAFSQEAVFEIVYLDGELEKKTPTGWLSGDLGTTLGLEDEIRLTPKSRAILTVQGLELTITTPGPFRLKDLLENFRTKGVWEVALMGRLQKLAGRSGPGSLSAMGVRGTDQNLDPGLNQAQRELRQEAETALAEGRAEEAHNLLLDVLDLTSPDREQEVLDLLGLAAVLRSSQAQKASRYYDQAVLAKEGLSFSPAPDIQQTLWYLVYLAEGNLNNREAQEMAAEKVLQAGADTPLGLAVKAFIRAP